MKIHEIRAPKGANKNRKRIGRGNASGWGKTAGRGENGQNSRSGGGVRPGFEGGQMPLQRRIPKFGFTNIFRKLWAEVKLSDIEMLDSDVIDYEILFEAGLLRSGIDGVKILGNGEITRAVTVRVEKVTKGAREKIEAAGGKVELVETPERHFELDVGKASRIDSDVIDLETAKKAGLAPEGVEKVRLVKRGIMKDSKTFRFNDVSRSARRAIRISGGKIEEPS